MSEEKRFFNSPVWAIVQMMGRKVLVGEASQPEGLPGTVFRLDIPEHDGIAAATKLIGFSALYDLTIVDEETAMLALSHSERPVSTWHVPTKMIRPPDPQKDFEDEGDPFDYEPLSGIDADVLPY
jgi:hypothetical protein